MPPWVTSLTVMLLWFGNSHRWHNNQNTETFFACALPFKGGLDGKMEEKRGGEDMFGSTSQENKRCFPQARARAFDAGVTIVLLHCQFLMSK